MAYDSRPATFLHSQCFGDLGPGGKEHVALAASQLIMINPRSRAFMR
jgi:hypothetical protein